VQDSSVVDYNNVVRSQQRRQVPYSQVYQATGGSFDEQHSPTVALDWWLLRDQLPRKLVVEFGEAKSRVDLLAGHSKSACCSGP
jgi:hypothetical protein